MRRECGHVRICQGISSTWILCSVVVVTHGMVALRRERERLTEREKGGGRQQLVLDKEFIMPHRACL